AEVAANRVLLDRAPDVVADDASVDDMPIAFAAFLAGAAKGRHLDDLGPEHHVRKPETAADQAAIAKQLLHLVRRGIGGDVEILRRDPEQQVAHGATDQMAA